MSDPTQCPAVSTWGSRCDRWEGHGGSHTAPAGTLVWWDPTPLQREATITGIDSPPRRDALPGHAGNHHTLITGDGNTMRIEWNRNEP